MFTFYYGGPLQQQFVITIFNEMFACKDEPVETGLKCYIVSSEIKMVYCESSVISIEVKVKIKTVS